MTGISKISQTVKQGWIRCLFVTMRQNSNMTNILISIGMLFGAIFLGCSMPASYDNAVDLIKQRRYEEARNALKEIQDDKLSEIVEKAILLCNVGLLYEERKVEDALSLACKTAEDQGNTYFVLYYMENDPLFAHTTSLVHLIKGEKILLEANALLEDGDGDPEWLQQLIRSYRRGYFLDEEGYVGYEGSQAVAQGYINEVQAIGLLQLPEAPEFKAEIAKMKSNVEKLSKAVTEYAENQAAQWHAIDQSQVLEEQDASMDQWIQGKWISDNSLMGNRRLGINIGDEIVSFTTYWANWEEENSDYYYYIVCNVYSSSIKIIKGETREVFERRFLCNTRGDIFERVEGSKLSYGGGTFSRVE